MGKLFVIMGKSSSGKDTIYNRLREEKSLRSIITYTTRPRRAGERDGDSYFFVDEGTYERMKENGLILEERSYDTVHGIWRYFTARDSQLDGMESDGRYLMVGTLEAYLSLRETFGPENVIPLYIEVEDGVRLKRALERETAQAKPRYREMCRRYLADCEDFSEEKLLAAGIDRRFCNNELEECLKLCGSYIDGY